MSAANYFQFGKIRIENAQFALRQADQLRQRIAVFLARGERAAFHLGLDELFRSVHMTIISTGLQRVCNRSRRGALRFRGMV